MGPRHASRTSLGQSPAFHPANATLYQTAEEATTRSDTGCEASPDAENAKERAPRVGGDALSNPPGCGNWVGRK
jgi:hypothetical protein